MAETAASDGERLPGAGIPIRALTPAEAEAFRALRLCALADAPEAFGASHADEAGQPLSFFADRLANAPPSRVFGAFADGRLVAMAGFRATSVIKSRHRGTLWGVYVAPAGRRRGLGEALVAAVIAHARQHVLVLQARVVTGNHTARALYARLGFRPYGVEAKALCIDGVFHDEALLALDFTPEAAGGPDRGGSSPPR